MKSKHKTSGRRIGLRPRAVINLLKSSGYLFPETDEQMTAYEANVKLRELPEKFRTPEFVFKAAQTQSK